METTLGADDSVRWLGSGASFLDNESSGWNGWCMVVERVVSALSGFVVEEIP